MKKKCKLKCFNISQKYLYIKKIKNFAPKFGAFSSEGALGNGLIGLSLRLALGVTIVCKKAGFMIKVNISEHSTCNTIYPLFFTRLKNKIDSSTIYTLFFTYYIFHGICLACSYFINDLSHK